MDSDNWYPTASNLNGDRILYTEENSPVRTVHISNFHWIASQQSIMSLFQNKVGPVESVRLHQHKHKLPYTRQTYHGKPVNTPVYGFVTFIDPKDAYKAVQMRSIVHDRHKLRIKQADSWHQPNGTADDKSNGPSTSQVPSTSKEFGASSLSANPSTQESPELLPPILQLNSDCLLAIYKYLTPTDVVNMSDTCTQLRAFADDNIYRKYKKLDFKFVDQLPRGQITLSQLRNLLKHFGEYIETVHVTDSAFVSSTYRYILFLLKFCKNLQNLYISTYSFSETDYKMFRTRSDVRSITLDDCSGITDDWVTVMKNFPRLETLRIRNNREIKGQMFATIRNLTHLSLIGCSNIITEHIKAVFVQNTTLRSLTMKQCGSLSSEIFSEIPKYLPDLEHLCIHLNTLNGPNQLNCLADLNHLTKLQLISSMFNVSTYLSKLGDRNLLEELDVVCSSFDSETCTILKKFKKLKILRIRSPFMEDSNMMDLLAVQLPTLEELYCSGCHSVTDDVLVKFVKMSKNLTTLTIKCSMGVTENAIRHIVEVLKKDDGTRPLLKLNINTVFLQPETEEILALNKSLIKFTDHSIIDLENPDIDHEDDDFYDGDDDDTDDFDFDGDDGDDSDMFEMEFDDIFGYGGYEDYVDYGGYDYISDDDHDMAHPFLF